MLLLQRLSDAERDGNRVLGVVREVAASTDFSGPGNSLRKALQRVMDAAGTPAEEVLAVEAVGTVPSIETCEVAAVRDVAATPARREPVLINSLDVAVRVPGRGARPGGNRQGHGGRRVGAIAGRRGHEEPATVALLLA